MWSNVYGPLADIILFRYKDRKMENGKERERERDYKFIQKHSRGLNRVPARTYIFACLNQLSYRCHKRETERETEREIEGETEGET